MKNLKIDDLRSDPRVMQAKAMLLEAVKDHGERLKTIEPGDPDKMIAYQELIQSLSIARGTNLFYPYLGSGFGRGSLVELMDGSVKYDMITGIGVHYLGHFHPAIVEASIDAACSSTVMQGNLQQNRESLILMEELIRRSGLPHCFLTTSGAMANENALKVAFQKNAPAHRILAFEHCFAGRTLTFSQVTDKPSFRDGLPINLQVDYLPFYDPKKPMESQEAAVKALLKYIERYPQSHAVMIFELIQGEAGFYVGSKSFFEALMKICQEHHIAIFIDEVQTFARTPSLFAFQYFGLEKYVDILALGKLSQVCATLFTDQYKPRPGLLSQTYTGSSSSIYSCLALLKVLSDGNFFGREGRIAEVYERFERHLKQIEEEDPKLIVGPYGIGGMIAFTPYDGKLQNAIRFAEVLFQNGVISFIAGSNPTRIRFLVPMAAITDEEIDHVMQIVKNTLTSFKKHVSR